MKTPIPPSDMIALRRAKSMGRTRFQNGSLYVENGQWKARFREPVVENGQVVRKNRSKILGWKKDLTEKQAKRLLADILRPINDVGYQPLSMVTFADFADKWIKQILTHLAFASQVSQESIINAHLLPEFGEYHLKDINLELVQLFVNKLATKLSGTTIKQIVGLMMRMWDTAIGWGYANHNPFPRGVTGKLLLRLPKKKKPKTYNFTPEESLAIIDKAPEFKWKVLFWTFAEVGPRPGEIAGLRKIDLDGRILTFAQSVYRQKIQMQKTDDSEREVPISQDLADALRAYIAETEAEENPRGLIWTTDKGNPLDMSYVIKKILNPILDELGIREKVKALGMECGLYPFRRMNITELRRRGVPLKTIQKRVGHAAGSTVTDEHYVKAVDADNEAATEYMGSMLRPKKEGEAIQ